MKIEQVYIRATELVDLNARNQVELDKPRFVLFFNLSQLEYLTTIIELGRSSDRVQLVQKFLVSNKLGREKKTDQYFQYKLPEDFLRREEIRIKASKGKCSGFLDGSKEVKPSDIPFLLSDEHSKPSFDFRETLYYIRTDSVIIYGVEEFDIDSVDLVYYRKPTEVDMYGYINELGEASTNKDPEWDEEHINGILSILVDKFTRAKLPIKEVQ